MFLSTYDEFIYSGYVQQTIEKFKYTFLSKFPDFISRDIDYNTLLKIYYLHNCNFNVYFYLDTIKYLKENDSTLDENDLLTIVKFCAIHTLYDQNTINFISSNTCHLFYRNKDKIHYLSGTDSSKINKIISSSLNTFYC